MIPIVFYNGDPSWNAVQSLQEYQQEGLRYGEYILNLKYYLVDLSKVDEEYILSTNTVIDNIMYCDKFRRKLDLITAVHNAYTRVNTLSLEERESFDNWAKHILLTICDNSETMIKEIIKLVKQEDENMAFQYNIVRVFEEERRKYREEGRLEGQLEGRLEGRSEGRATILKLIQFMINNGEISLINQLENEDFCQEMCKKYNIL